MTPPPYRAADDRYEHHAYRRCGRSGLKLPAVSLGLWHNFGDDKPIETQRAILRRAFDRGVTHFDLANNYGPPYGAAETQLRRDLRPGLPALPRRAGDLDQGRLRHVARAVRRVGVAQVPAGLARPEPGPDGPGPRRHLLQPPVRPGDAARGDHGRARDRRAVRAGDVRRHLVVLRRADPRGGRAAARDGRAAADPPAVVLDAQPLGRGRRWPPSLLDVLGEEGVGCIAFSPLAQGMLTDRYLDGIPEGSRAAQGKSLDPSLLTDEALAHIRRLNEIAQARGQSLAQLALAWVLRDERVTSVLIGASSVAQLDDNLAVLDNLELSGRARGDRAGRRGLRDQHLGTPRRSEPAGLAASAREASWRSPVSHRDPGACASLPAACEGRSRETGVKAR